MNHCQFHPLDAATWHCPHCFYNLCDHCIDESRPSQCRCLSCENEVNSLGSAHSAIPFWRNLEASFRYPMTGGAITLIVGIAFLYAILPGNVVGFLLELVLTGVMFSYSFHCLRETAHGNTRAPSVNNIKGNGIDIVVRLFLLIAAMILLSGVASELFGAGVGILTEIIFFFATPAIIINFAISESILSAINPRRNLEMISAIGAPYALILAFLFIMVSSIFVIHELLGSYTFLSTLLQNAVTNYYMIVMFQIMGYMIFQNQGSLGFAAREDSEKAPKLRSELERNRARIQLLLKEGRYGEVTKLYAETIKANPDDKNLAEECFRFLLGIRDLAALAEFTSFYLDLLARKNLTDQLPAIYKRVIVPIPDYLPDTAALRHTLAQALFARGDFQSASKMLNKLHTTFPDYGKLGEAYALMADCLEAMPATKTQAEKYRQFAPQKTTSSNPANHTSP